MTDPMGSLARQDEYLPDVGDPLVPSGPQVSPGTILGNKVADVLSRYPGHVMGSLASLPQRAFGASEEMRAGGDYDPAPALETALMTMGTGAVAGAPVRGGEAVFGAGAVRPKAVKPEVMGDLAKPAVIVPEEASRILRPNPIERYLTDPQRVAYPGVYKRPDVIAAEAAANVAEEHSALKQLFGVTRDDLYEISQRGKRQGNIEPDIWQPTKPRGSYAADAIMNPANAQRMVDTLAEAQKYPALIKGMDPWYVMDPAYQQMVRLYGAERAPAEYARFNASVSPFSAGSDVLTEINRGTAANMMRTRGEYPTFRQYGGVAESKRGADFPEALRDVKGHAYHGVQADPVTRYLETGSHGYDKDTVKIPLYTQASGVPETGFQTKLPVPDAHFTRAAGMPDVRKNLNYSDYMGGSEYRPFGPWYRENVAKPLGIEAVPAQARMWGTYAPQTGVATKIGAGKLELLSQAISERAAKLGIDPKKLRDDVLTGKAHATWLLGGLTGAMGALARQDEYQ